MFDHDERVNAKSSDNTNLKKKSALDGMWNTLINSASAHEMKLYMAKSPMVTTKVIPSIVNDAVVKYEYIQKNMVRSLAVLYEGGISSKKQYNRKRSQEIFEVDQDGKKHQISYIKRWKIDGLQKSNAVCKSYWYWGTERYSQSRKISYWQIAVPTIWQWRQCCCARLL